MTTFAMVILIPFICSRDHKEMQSYEIGILIASATAGQLSASRFTEPAINKLGTKWAIQLSFLFLVGASFAFWFVSQIINDSDFMAYAFMSRFLYGFGAGLLQSIIMVARAQSKKGKQEMQAKDYFKWQIQAEAFGYLMGPLLLVVTMHSDESNDRTCMWLAIAQATIWFIFTVCFHDSTQLTGN